MTTINEMFRPELIPPGIKRGLDNYINHGLRPGDALYSILVGDLYKTIAHADVDTLTNLAAIVAFIATKLHPSIWGTHAAVDAWIARGEAKLLERAERGE